MQFNPRHTCARVTVLVVCVCVYVCVCRSDFLLLVLECKASEQAYMHMSKNVPDQTLLQSRIIKKSK